MKWPKYDMWTAWPASFCKRNWIGVTVKIQSDHYSIFLASWCSTVLAKFLSLSCCHDVERVSLYTNGSLNFYGLWVVAHIWILFRSADAFVQPSRFSSSWYLGFSEIQSSTSPADARFPKALLYSSEGDTRSPQQPPTDIRLAVSSKLQWKSSKKGREAKFSCWFPWGVWAVDRSFRRELHLVGCWSSGAPIFWKCRQWLRIFGGW